MDVTQIIIAMFGLLAVIVTSQLIPWLRQKIGAEKWERLLEITTVAVEAAEQLGITGVVKDKLAYAEEQVSLAMSMSGITYDSETVRAAIEAAVLEMRNEKDKWLASMPDFDDTDNVFINNQLSPSPPK